MAGHSPGIRAVVFGRPLSNEDEMEERLSKKKALAIFSSDAISSSAYATEEILRVLVIAGAGALLVSIQVSIAIALLLAVVSVSYRQVCRAYPNGGGAYVVARTNLAPVFGLIAAAALLIDYVMTVAVSTAAAITQIQSVFPAAYDVRIEIAFISIGLITIANLRGLRESGNIFAVPTYLFIGLALGIVAIGVSRIVTGTVEQFPTPPDAVPFGTETLGVLLLLKAFAGGSVALTGVEAIANGVPAFKPPEARNAADTMTAMAILLAILFVGLTVVAVAFGLRPTEEGGPSVVAMAAQAAFGAGSPLVLHVRGEHRAHPVPRREHELQRLPATGRDPRRRTATCLASSRSAATASRTRGGSCSWPRSPSGSCGPSAAIPTRSSRSIRSASSCASR